MNQIIIKPLIYWNSSKQPMLQHISASRLSCFGQNRLQQSERLDKVTLSWRDKQPATVISRYCVRLALYEALLSEADHIAALFKSLCISNLAQNCCCKSTPQSDAGKHKLLKHRGMHRELLKWHKKGFMHQIEEKGIKKNEINETLLYGNPNLSN